jgi:hypothetical protein
MPNLNISVVLAYIDAVNGNSFVRPYSNLITVAGNSYDSHVQVIGTDSEAITDIVDIGTAGYMLFKNLDDTNYIQFAVKEEGTDVFFAKLLPGEFMLMRYDNEVIYAKANTAACDLAVTIIED